MSIVAGPERHKNRNQLLTADKPSLFTTTAVVSATVLSAAYLFLSIRLLGFKSDQVVLILLCNGLYFGSRISRNFMKGFSVFAVYWILFDYQKAFPNYVYNTVHIQDLYLLEKSWFGIEWRGAVLTPNEFLLRNTIPFLDFISGLFYLCWIPVPLAFAALVFFKNRSVFFQFAFAWVVVNIIGWTGYYSFPAAPPWYVAEHGFAFLPGTPGNMAGLGRFDALFGISLFKSIYEKSSNVFAAMPSLHSAYVMLVAFYAWKAGWKAWGIAFGAVAAGIWFSAVYTSHHYVLDVLAGIGSATVSLLLMQWWVKSRMGKATLQRMIRATSA